MVMMFGSQPALRAESVRGVEVPGGAADGEGVDAHAGLWIGVLEWIS